MAVLERDHLDAEDLEIASPTHCPGSCIPENALLCPQGPSSKFGDGLSAVSKLAASQSPRGLH